MVAAGSMWPPRPALRRLQLPQCYGPLYTGRGVPSPPAASLRPPPGLPHQRGARDARPGGGAPPVGPPHGLCVPPQPHSPPDTPPCPPRGGGACPLGPDGPPTTRAGHYRLWTGQHPGPTMEGIPVSHPGPPVTLGPAPRALGRRDGDPFRRPNCDGRTPGPHTRGTRSLPVPTGHVDSGPRPVGSGHAETAPGPRESNWSY